MYYSFEYFPLKTEKGIQNFNNKLETFIKLHPLFMNMTWGVGGYL
jgi:methylenetetrahydrofolate reductase (NADPH)